MRTAAPVIPAFILNGPPTMERVSTIYKGASQEAIAAQYAAAMLEYQMYNTAFWDAIEPSLRFEGAYEAMDRLHPRRRTPRDHVMDSIVPDGSPAFIGSHNQPGDEPL